VTLASRIQAAWLQRGGLSLALWPLSWLYGALFGLRRLLYRAGWKPVEKLPVPLVVVGNLIVGGAGKTPTTLAVVQLLRQQGWTPGIVSRGYGREGDAVQPVTRGTPVTQAGDEPLLMHLRTQAPVVVGRDRAAAGRELLRQHPTVDVIVSDDGRQHWRLARSAEVIVFDERGAGNGRLLPAGPLREPLTKRPPARSVVLYNADRPSTPWPGHCARRGLGGVVLLDAWWRGEPASSDALQAVATRPVWAAAGMARPQRFFDMLTRAGLQVHPLPLPDHHDFATLPWPADAADVVVTEKDAVKLDPARVGGTRVWVATLDFAPGAAFETELLRLLPPRPARTAHGHPTA
jgi:tetraacyldisaccharide 4'-kinase